MAQQTINVGSSANDGTGDPARTAGQKINANFTELYGSVAQLQAGNGLSGPLTLLAGNAAAPSLRLSGDTDTGLFSGGAGVLGVAVDGTERARFTSSGLVLETALAIASGGTGASSASVARSNLGLAIGSQVQAWDADLDAIAALAGTSGLLRKTAANTWALETAVYLTGNQTITFTGDATGNGATAVGLTLANSGVTAGAYANASVTVDAKGRVTAATANPNPVTSFSGGTTGLTPSVGTSGAVVLSGTLGVANGGTGATTLTGFVKGNGTGAMTAQAKIAIADLDTTGTPNSGTYLRGDGTWGGVAGASGGTVTSVAVSGGSTGLTTSGGPVTGAGTITLGGTLAVANGGTGATTATGTGSVVRSSTPTLTTPVINGFTGDTSIVNIGSGQIYKDTSGRLGLGTSSPSTKMTIADAGEAGTRYLGNGLTSAGLFVGYNSAAYVYNDSNTPMIFGTNGSERMRIDTSGNVGIGTSSPGYRLDVLGTLRSTGLATFDNAISLNTASLNYLYYTSALAFAQTGTGERMRIDASGNVGIGTSSPAWRLTAVGGSTQISPGTSAQEGIRFTRSTGVCTINGINNDNNAYNALSFATGASEAVRIDTSGNLQFNSGYGSVATAFGCRAWVNFNGTGTVAIRASGNVSSITDNGTGDYTVNFTTAMPDANYCVVASGAPTTTPTNAQRWPATVGTLAAGSVRVLTPQDGTTGSTLGDFALVHVAVFR